MKQGLCPWAIDDPKEDAFAVSTSMMEGLFGRRYGVCKRETFPFQFNNEQVVEFERTNFVAVDSIDEQGHLVNLCESDVSGTKKKRKRRDQ